ncbi:hypothetical protein H312_03401 [Anncaliia algerae PRA339]|uniref:Uncharacterized protein n=1 Tax=Anncaliia algerae PRA339 TaxID=1288291 RepID=A0A059EW01_9MICR|nr:hypothetical protein H312_03401 [Anncaliia algerae PRA339]
MNRVVKSSSDEFQTLFFELGVNNELPENWNRFKEILVDFCIEQSLYTIRNIKKRSGGYI